MGVPFMSMSKSVLSVTSLYTVYKLLVHGRPYILKKAHHNGLSRGRLMHEYGILRRIDHPNIIRVIGMVGHAMVMECMECDMAYVIRCGDRVRIENEHRGWLYQIACALAYLHGRGIVHGDFKPSNVLVSGGVVKVSDFDISAKMDMDGACAGTRKVSDLDVSAKMDGACGTVHTTLPYRSPELLLDRQLTASADMWSLGCTAYEMMCQTPLFSESTEIGMLDRMFSIFGYHDSASRYINRMHHHQYTFVELMASKGRTAEQTMFLKDFFVYDIALRVRADEVLRCTYLTNH